VLEDNLHDKVVRFLSHILVGIMILM
jgi:hypothetical protein